MATTKGRQASALMAWGLGVRLLGFLGLLVTGTQCAPHPRPASLPTKPNTPSQIKTWLTAPSWNARFSNATELSTCVELNAQSRLCVGALGERWLDGPDGALASPYLAPETLVSALPAELEHVGIRRKTRQPIHGE